MAVAGVHALDPCLHQFFVKISCQVVLNLQEIVIASFDKDIEVQSMLVDNVEESEGLIEGGRARNKDCHVLDIRVLAVPFPGRVGGRSSFRRWLSAIMRALPFVVANIMTI